MASFLDVCRFTPTLGGTTDWTVSAAVTGYQTPASAGAVNASVYRYRAESADLTQWEVGYGAYTVAGTVLARTTVLFNSSGTTAKINFSTVPQVAVVALAEDFSPLLVANGGTGDTGTAWTAYTPSIAAQSGTFTTVSATGRYKTIGKTTFITITITATNIGTAAGYASATLPNISAAEQYTLSGGNFSTGKSMRALIGISSSAALIANYDNTFPLASGQTVTVSGVYESA